MKWFAYRVFGSMILFVMLSALGCRDDVQTEQHNSPTRGEDYLRTDEKKTQLNQRSSLPPMKDVRVDPPGSNDPATQEYVTDILVYAGCNSNPESIEVANKHLVPGECESIHLTPAMDQDGDFFEVYGVFEWTSSDPMVADVLCTGSAKHNTCTPLSNTDFFDNGTQEPAATLMTCVHNECPAPDPQDCLDMVCIDLEVVSIVNLEGLWACSGVTFDSSSTLSVHQDGRTLLDGNAFPIGEVHDDSVMFDLDDYRYEGTIVPDRAHLNGTVTDLMNDVVIGTWEAEKLAP